MDQLTGGTAGGEGGRLTGHCRGGFGDNASRAGAAHRGRGLSIGWESGLGGLRGGSGATVELEVRPWNGLLTLETERERVREGCK